MIPFSVLISLYIKEKPEYLRQALASVFDQTCPPSEVVLVLDGPITDELRAVVDSFVSRYSEILKTVPLEKNIGLGAALNEGLKHCSHQIVARMDTDDICRRDRFEKQLEMLHGNPDIDIVGSWIDEFMGDTDHIVSTRRLPEDHGSIAAYAKKRSPINHPSVIFRKSAILKAGGYMHFPLFEDYYLWVRMLMNGGRFANIPESLVYMRVSPDMYKRRGGSKYARDEWRLQREFKKMGFISNGEMVSNMAIRSVFRLIPNGPRAFLYKKLLRK